jgi:hypothetical protein
MSVTGGSKPFRAHRGPARRGADERAPLAKWGTPARALSCAASAFVARRRERSTREIGFRDRGYGHGAWHFAFRARCAAPGARTFEFGARKLGRGARHFEMLAPALVSDARAFEIQAPAFEFGARRLGPCVGRVERRAWRAEFDALRMKRGSERFEHLSWRATPRSRPVDFPGWPRRFGEVPRGVRAHHLDAPARLAARVGFSRPREGGRSRVTSRLRLRLGRAGRQVDGARRDDMSASSACFAVFCAQERAALGVSFSGGERLTDQPAGARTGRVRVRSSRTRTRTRTRRAGCPEGAAVGVSLSFGSFSLDKHCAAGAARTAKLARRAEGRMPGVKKRNRPAGMRDEHAGMRVGCRESALRCRPT